MRADDIESGARASPPHELDVGEKSVMRDSSRNPSHEQDNSFSQHALLSSAKELGEATASLPVVSTLSFGFAMAELLAQAGSSSHPSVLLLLALSASCSLYTTTFSLLEYYYLTMLAASDARASHLQGHPTSPMKAQDGSAPGAAPAPLVRQITSFERDRLAKRVDHELLRFESWRWWARNLLWLSVFLLIAAAATQTALEQGIEHWTTIAILVVLASGAVFVPITVGLVRRSFVPVLVAYRRQEIAAAKAAKRRSSSMRRMPSRVLSALSRSNTYNLNLPVAAPEHRLPTIAPSPEIIPEVKKSSSAPTVA